MDRRTRMLDALANDAGARLGAFAWLLAHDDEHAAQLFNAGLDGVATRVRVPRSVARAEAIARHAMAMKAATDARRQREAQPSPAPAHVPTAPSHEPDLADWLPPHETAAPPAAPLDAPPADASVSQESAPEPPEQASALRTLPPKTRIALVLHHADQRSPRAIARVLRTTVNRVEASLEDGRAAIAEAMGVPVDTVEYVSIGGHA